MARNQRGAGRMNNWTAYTIISISMVLLTGFVFYLTGSFWTLLILILIPSMSEQVNADENEEVGQDEET